MPTTTVGSEADPPLLRRQFEAQAFALLAWAAAKARPASLPAVTGEREPWILGQIAPGRGFAGVRESRSMVAKASTCR